MPQEDSSEQEYSPWATTQMFQQQDDFSKWRLDTDSIIGEMEHNLAGDVWIEDDKGSRWESIKANRTMSTEGIKQIAGVMRMTINKVSFLSNLNDDDVMDITRDLNKTIVDMLYLNWKAWNVKKDNLSNIVVSLSNLIYMALKRAQDEGERLALRQTEQVHRYPDASQKSHGRFDWIPFVGGGKE